MARRRFGPQKPDLLTGIGLRVLGRHERGGQLQQCPFLHGQSGLLRNGEGLGHLPSAFSLAWHSLPHVLVRLHDDAQRQHEYAVLSHGMKRAPQAILDELGSAVVESALSFGLLMMTVLGIATSRRLWS